MSLCLFSSLDISRVIFIIIMCCLNGVDIKSGRRRRCHWFVVEAAGIRLRALASGWWRPFLSVSRYLHGIIIFWREQDGWQTFIILRRPGLMFRFPCLCTFHCQVYHMNANLFLECSINVRLFLTVDVVYVFNNLSSIILFALKVLL